MWNRNSKKSTHSRNYLGYLTGGGMISQSTSTHSRNYLGYLTINIDIWRYAKSTHSRNYLGYLTILPL